MSSVSRLSQRDDASNAASHAIGIVQSNCVAHNLQALLGDESDIDSNNSGEIVATADQLFEEGKKRKTPYTRNTTLDANEVRSSRFVESKLDLGCPCSSSIHVRSADDRAKTQYCQLFKRSYSD